MNDNDASPLERLFIVCTRVPGFDKYLSTIFRRVSSSDSTTITGAKLAQWCALFGAHDNGTGLLGSLIHSVLLCQLEVLDSHRRPGLLGTCSSFTYQNFPFSLVVEPPYL